MTAFTPQSTAPADSLAARGLTFMSRLLQAFVADEMPKGLDIEINLYPARDLYGEPSGLTRVQVVGYWPGIDEVDGSFGAGPAAGEADADALARAQRMARELVRCGAPGDRIRIRRNAGAR